MLRASKKPKPGSRLIFTSENGVSYEAVVGGRQGEFFELTFNAPALTVLDAVGKVPLPPYIERDAQAADEGRYQTVYAKYPLQRRPRACIFPRSFLKICATWACRKLS